MRQVSIHEAKTHLSRLIEAVRAGEEIVIAKGSMPVARLVPLEPKPFKFGSLAEAVGPTAPDFTEPLDPDELAAWEGAVLNDPVR